MLVNTITKTQPQKIYIGDDIVIYIWWEGGVFKVGVDAPENIQIERRKWEDE